MTSKPDKTSATSFLPPSRDLKALRDAAAGCRGCPLYENATQTVFGEGPARARLLAIGEQPGDREDRAGRPFVGPAGLLLDKALVAAGIDRETVFVTNAVKHFKWAPRGKRRIHRKPLIREIRACRPWLEAEVAAVRPAAVVCLGATAAAAAFGRSVAVGGLRGQTVASLLSTRTVVTTHPSAVLRIEDADQRAAAFDALVADLRQLADLA